jgi:hypothetical protein
MIHNTARTVFAASAGLFALCIASANAWQSDNGDGTNWKVLGGPFNLDYDWQTSTFQGEKYAIFCFMATALWMWIGFTLATNPNKKQAEYRR